MDHHSGLHGRFAEAPSRRPDIDDVRRRRRRRSWARAALGSALASALTLAAIAAFPFGNGSSERLSPALSAQGPPEGTFVLQMADEVQTLGQAGDTQTVDSGVEAFDTASDGDRAAATTTDPDRGRGLSLNPNLMVLHLETGQRDVIARGGTRTSFEDPTLSRDGKALAFRRAVWADSSLTGPPKEHICVADVPTRKMNCFQGLQDMTSFDWSPDGRDLIVAGYGTEPVYVIEAATGKQSVLLPSGGTKSVRDALADRGYGSLDQFILPEWSADGRLVAGAASVQGAGSVPLVVDRNGGFVAMGTANAPDLQRLAWSPSDPSLLAYSMGFNGVGPEDAPFEARLLNVTTGEDELLVDTSEEPTSFISSVHWSPSGRFVALNHEVSIQVVDISTREVQNIDLNHPDAQDANETLRSWTP